MNRLRRRRANGTDWEGLRSLFGNTIKALRLVLSLLSLLLVAVTDKSKEYEL